MKNRLSMWQVHHGSFSFVLPLLLVAILAALRYGRIEQLLRKLQIGLLLRGKNAGAASSQVASRMYAEMLHLMGRHGYPRSETQTPFEFAAAVTKPALSPMVQEFTQLYSLARFGGATCDIARLQELLGTIRGELRAR
jgi:hypothetical protein